MSEPIRWGILSTANIATKVGSAIQSATNADLLAIASRCENKAREWAEVKGVPKYYGSYDSLLNDEEIDAIYIPLPPSMHAEWVIRSAEHGKHILCEKPIAANFSQALEMAHACREHKLQLMDGVMWVHHQRTAVMKQIIEKGNLGSLRRVASAFTFNWDQIPEDNIRTKKELGGGSLGDLGYYCVRAILWAFDDLPERVFATVRNKSGVDFNVTAMLWFQKDRMATFDCGFDTVLRKWFEISGTKGSIVCDDFTVPSSDEARFWLHDSRGQAAVHKIKDCVQEVNMIENFSQHIHLMKEKSQPIRTDWIDIAVNTQRVCQAINKSAENSDIVNLADII